MTAIIDYDAGNIKSVEKALQFLGESVVITREREELLKADRVILPGVGSFGDAMEKIRHYELESVIQEVARKGIPFLGICLGMQLLFDGSDECKNVKGLGLLPGSILRIPDVTGIKVPHIGWNSLKFPHNTRLFNGIQEDSYVYFVHSYYLKARNENVVAATTEYGTLIHAAVESNNIFGCQFHPEKSSKVGLRILKNFIEMNREVNVNAYEKNYSLSGC